MLKFLVVLAIAAAGLPGSGRVSAASDLFSVAHLSVPYSQPPGEEELRVPEEEDEAFLDGVLREIFPEGTGGLSDEAKAIEILRYMSSALELKNNGGSATKILKEGYAICGGLSHAFRILCRKVGLPSRYIGAFYLRPIMGGHAISEVYYGGKWRLLDPTFGFFFYSRAQYDGEGEVASFHDLVLAPEGWTAFKVVARPWVGRYDGAIQAFGVAPVEADYLKDVYGTPILELYRKYAAEAFPIAYGQKDRVSFPVDGDLREAERMQVGEADGDSRDVVLQALNGTAYAGSHYVGGSFPPGFHTWSIRTPGRCRVRIVYHSANADPPELRPAPLKAVRIVDVVYGDRQARFDLQVIGPEAILAVHCPEGTFIVDAMAVERTPFPPSLRRGEGRAPEKGKTE